MSEPFTPVKRKKRRANQRSMAPLSWVDKLERDSHELGANSAWVDTCIGQSAIRFTEISA